MSEVFCNGLRMHYTEAGQGEPLILIMGLGASGEKWAPHVAAYEKEFHCIAIDNRGAGLTDAPMAEAYTTQQMAEDTIALMDALKIESAHIHGISMGGAIAQWVAIRAPERVRSLILTSTFGYATNSFRRAIEILRDSNGHVDGNTFTHLLNWMIWSEAYHENHYAEIVASENEAASDPHPMSVAHSELQCNACITHDARSELHRIAAPTLVARGGVDLLAPMHVTDELIAAIPRSRILCLSCRRPCSSLGVFE